MEYRNYGGTCYVRIDKGEDIIRQLMEVCRREQVVSAVYSGIGGCDKAQIQTFIPATGAFETQELSGMLELVSLMGNVVSDDGELYHHAHGSFSYKCGEEHRMAAGHIKSITVLYTAEIELRPVMGGVIRKKYDPQTGTGFWSFS